MEPQDSVDASAPAGGAQAGDIGSWRDFQDRVRAVMAMAAAQGADLTLVDADFTQWPLGERSVMEAFHQWTQTASRGALVRLLAARYDAFPRSHPRWVAWRGTWGHKVRCWQMPTELADTLTPMLVVHDAIGLKIHDALRGRGVWTRDRAVLRSWLQEIDANLQRSHEALPPTTLGL